MGGIEKEGRIAGAPLRAGAVPIHRGDLRERGPGRPGTLLVVLGESLGRCGSM